MKKISGIRYRGNGTYYECHHIVPASLNGSDEDKNLVLLTAREHFICHWLLIKRYEKGTIERNKMMYAFWRMQSNPTQHNKRYINSRAYEYLKTEFVKMVGEITKITQAGDRNSQYGKRWYTNIDTGESKRIKNNTDPRWIKGKNWFENQKIYSIKTKTAKYTLNGYRKIYEKVNNHTKELEIWTKQKWNEYHISNYKSLNAFYKDGNIDVSLVVLTARFKHFIPIYSKLSGQGKTFVPDKKLVNVFE